MRPKEYENLCNENLKKIGLSANTKQRDVGSGFSPSEVDGYFKEERVEYKSDIGAQMGGIVVGYDTKTNEFDISKYQFTKKLEDVILNHLKENEENFRSHLRNISEREKREINSFPYFAEKNNVSAKINKGFHHNSKIKNSDTNFMKEYYRNHKQTCYIQIGGLGFFHLGRNPLNLPIPELTGSMNLEVRTARNSLKKEKNNPNNRLIEIRIQGRFTKVYAKSQYSLDNEESISSLKEEMDKR